MGLIPDAVINMVLMGAFGIYCLMGLIFLIMGMVYMGDAGAIGATGLYLIFLGLVMLIVGGIALWANSNASWMILFIIELINVALFLFLYILIVIVLMMATGTTDPVRDAPWRHGSTKPHDFLIWPDGDESVATASTKQKEQPVHRTTRSYHH